MDASMDLGPHLGAANCKKHDMKRARSSAAEGGGVAPVSAGAGAGAGAAPQAPAPKRKKTAASEDPGFDLEGAEDLGDLAIPLFGLESVEDLPVIFIHAPPREGGLTTLIASLIIQAQDELGMNAAVVLCDRPGPNYMNNILPLGPQGTVLNQPPDRVLEELIRIQSDSSTLELGSGRRRIVFALDDVLYTSKLLSSEPFLRNIKRAKQYDIMVIIGATTPTVLPRIAATFITHAFTTKCYALDDIKALQKCLFGKFAKAEELAAVLELCQPHEFLVSIIRPSTTVAEITCRYTATVYRKHPLPKPPVGSRRVALGGPSRQPTGPSSVAAQTGGSKDGDADDTETETEDEEDVEDDGADTIREFIMDPKLSGYLSGTLAKLSSR